LILLQEAMDQGKEGTQDRLLPWLGRLVRGRVVLVDDLADGAVVELIAARGLAQTQLAGPNAATDFDPGVHVV
jgi:hypothetical protein